jgi:hypothetical protein
VKEMNNQYHEDATIVLQDLKGDELGRKLDAALMTYSTGEPRPGLEDRVLANLRIERDRAAAGNWWRWPALGLAAAALVAVGLLIGRPILGRAGKTTAEIPAYRSATAPQGDPPAGIRTAMGNLGSTIHPAVPALTRRPARHGVRDPQATVANGPRLDHFPSPRPLSREEKLLVRYVQDFPQEAILLAKAQAEFEEEMEIPGGNDAPLENQENQ